MFPSRVNVVYGKRWAIAKKQHGNCRVDIVHVSEVEKERQFRKNGDVKWLIQKDGRSEGFLIRNDHHPRRALTGGIPMMLESVSRSNINQRWLLCFPRGPPGPHEPFFIKSAISGMYLVVDEGLRMVTLQKDPPELHWRIHDATRKAESFSTSLVVPSSVQTAWPEEMVIASEFTEQKPTGGSSFGGNFRKTAFASYVFPKGRRLERDGTQRLEHAEQRQIAGLVDPQVCQSAAMAYAASQRFQKERLLTNYWQHAEGGVKLATFVTKKPACRSSSVPSLTRAAEPEPKAMPEPVQEPEPVEEVLSEPAFEEEEQPQELSASMQSRMMNSRWYPHPSLTRGSLKLSTPAALAQGVDPEKDKGHQCPFFEGSKHRFKDVQDRPDAQLRESMRSMKWKSEDLPCGGQLEEALALPDLEPYDGDVSSAFREGPASGRSVAESPDLDASSSFTPVEQMLHDEMVLCDAHELLPEGSGLAPGDVFQRLWGRGNSFVQSYQARRNGRDVFWSGPGISENRPWEAFAELKCSVRVPVLGWRPYQEVMRFALCYEPAAFSGKFSAMDVSEVLAVQLVGNVDAGSMGNFRSENLMLFYQPMCSGPTVLRALALTPKGRFSSMAVDGHRKALSDFIHAVQDEAKKWHVNGHQPVKAAVADAKAGGPPAEDCCFAGVCSLRDTCALM
eukprot:s327_g27.t1